VSEEKPELNFYVFLGIKSNETPENIKSLIRKLWRENHPDLFPEDKAKAQVTRLANSAEKWLLTPEQRVIHDFEFGISSTEKPGRYTREQQSHGDNRSESSGTRRSKRPPPETYIESSFQGRIHVEISKTRIVQLTFSNRSIRGVISASSGPNYYALVNKSVGDSVEILLDGGYVSGVILFLEPVF